MADHKNVSGSPDGEPVYLTVGFLRRPHGVQGEIIMDLHTDFPERMKKRRKAVGWRGAQLPDPEQCPPASSRIACQVQRD